MPEITAGVKHPATGQAHRDARGEEDMDDKDIRSQIHALVEEERELRNATEHTAEQRARITQLEQDLDQLWDLLRQRDAKRQYGENPDEAKPRPEPQVENYLQ
jgi:hypothetical protein